MANFMARPGQMVECHMEIGPLKKGVIYQILSIDFRPGAIYFVSIDFVLNVKHKGKYIQPVEHKE